MAVYKVLKEFRDKETKEMYEEGQEVELTVRRADEAVKNLKKWNGEFLERIDNKQEDPPGDPPGDDGEGERQKQEEGE